VAAAPVGRALFSLVAVLMVKPPFLRGELVPWGSRLPQDDAWQNISILRRHKWRTGKFQVLEGEASFEVGSWVGRMSLSFE
jgi:hypothetical protein